MDSRSDNVEMNESLVQKPDALVAGLDKDPAATEDKNLLPEFPIKDLFEASFHIGHKTRYWNPKAANFIYGSQNNIHIINLAKTVVAMRKACEKIRNVANSYGKILFVATKHQAQTIVSNETKRCAQPYITKIIGGVLTNFAEIKRSIFIMKRLRKEIENDSEKMTKKELSVKIKHYNKRYNVLQGIENMQELPKLIVIFDVNRERSIIKEAIKMKIPVVALVDTNSDPTDIQFPVPGNDDSMRSISLFAKICADSVVIGMKCALARSEQKNKEQKKKKFSEKIPEKSKVKKLEDKE